MVKSNGSLISQLSKIPEEVWRVVLRERLEGMNSRVETSPEARQISERLMLGQSSKPWSGLENDDVDAAVRVSKEEYDAKIVRDGESRNKSSDGHQSSSSHTMTRRETAMMIRRSRSTTSVKPVLQSPNPDPEYSPSSFVSKSKNRRHKKGKGVRGLEVEPNETDTPSEWLLNVMMREENGYNPKLISIKQLYETDLRSHQARLSISYKKVVNTDFLTEEETSTIDQQARKLRPDGESVVLVDPQMNRHVLNLRKWQMGDNWYYAFVDGWNNVVAANMFKVDDVFHIWSFRSGRGKLCFALVPQTTTTSTDSSHGGGSTSGESSSDDDSTSGEADHVPLQLPYSSPVRDPSHSGQGCPGESSSHSS